MGLAVLALSMPVRSAADAESESFRDAHQPLLDRGRVAGVTHFHAVEALVLKDAHLGLGAAISEVRRGGQAAYVVDQRGHLGKLGQRLLDVRRTPAPEVAAEGIRNVIARAAVDQSAGHVRAPQRSVVAAD